MDFKIKNILILLLTVLVVFIGTHGTIAKDLIHHSKHQKISTNCLNKNTIDEKVSALTLMHDKIISELKEIKDPQNENDAHGEFKRLLNVTIVLPKFYKDKTKVDKSIFKEIEKTFVSIAGGLTFYSAKGKWIDYEGNLLSDRNRVYEITTSKRKAKILEQYATYLKEILEQETIFFQTSEVKMKLL
ncbi:MAG: hypothetical protein AB1782_03835 [Cyanobacteriota bacterium]